MIEQLLRKERDTVTQQFQSNERECNFYYYINLLIIYLIIFFFNSEKNIRRDGA